MSLQLLLSLDSHLRTAVRQCVSNKSSSGALKMTDINALIRYVGMLINFVCCQPFTTSVTELEVEDAQPALYV